MKWNFQSLKLIFLTICVVFTVAACSSVPAEKTSSSPPIPNGALQKGSLANDKLILDAGTAASVKLAEMGFTIKKNQAFQPYVMSEPVGQPGGQSWTERWYFNVDGKWVPLVMDFMESGSGAADYVIRTDSEFPTKP